MSRHRGLGLVTARAGSVAGEVSGSPMISHLSPDRGDGLREGIPIEVAVIRDSAALAEIEGEWRALWRRSTSIGRTFHAYDWIAPWCTIFASRPDGTLAIVTVRRAGRLVAVWPLVERRLGPLRQLKWIGEPASQYHDVLAAPEPDLEAMLVQSWHALVHLLAPHHVCLRKVRADALVAPVLEALGARVVARDDAPFLDLASAPSAEAYEQRYAARDRKNRRRLLRRLEEGGRVTTETVPAGARAGALVAQAVALKRQWAARRGALSRALACSGLEPLLLALVTHRGGDLDCRVGALTVEGEIASIQLAFREDDRLLLHLIVYDERFERSGVGTLHIERTLRDCFEDGVATLDLLGPADTYKLAWADAATEIRDYTVAFGPIARAFDWAYDERARGRAKAWFDRLPTQLRRRIAGLLSRRRAQGMRPA